MTPFRTVPSRRDWLRATAAGLIASPAASAQWTIGLGQEPGARPARSERVAVLNPRARVPVGLIIDDSSCLVNLAHFAIPQFAEVFPDQYQQDWRRLPREIPDSFVRRFAAWCRDHHVRGKYSLVPYPACVGWLDRDLPGWTRRDLEASLELVRQEVAPDWDIHPEMVSHTWAIDTLTGRPFPERSMRFMENWGFSMGKSADELADYLAFALRILRNAGLRCEGITTPGGFGNAVLPALAQATLESVRDVFSAEIPHYFRHLYEDEHSVAPRVEYASDLEGPDPRCVVSIIGCTGDWFGGWDGLEVGSPDRFIGPEGRGGRLPEVIARGEPTVMVCHWPGLYCNGDETGFHILQQVVTRLESTHDNLLWMRLADLARYWAARTLTTLATEQTADGAVTAVRFSAPFACPAFTVQIERPTPGDRSPTVLSTASTPSLREVDSPRRLESSTWHRDPSGRLTACFDLPQGPSQLVLSGA